MSFPGSIVIDPIRVHDLMPPIQFHLDSTQRSLLDRLQRLLLEEPSPFERLVRDFFQRIESIRQQRPLSSRYIFRLDVRAKKSAQYLVAGAVFMIGLTRITALSLFVLAGSCMIAPIRVLLPLVALNYTLLHYRPSSLTFSLLKANFLFWKGDICKWLLVPSSSYWCHQWYKLNAIADRSWAVMLVQTLPENFAGRRVDAVWRDRLIARLIQRGVRFPSYNRLSFDLVKLNDLARLVEEDNPQPPHGVAAAPRAEIPQAIRLPAAPQRGGWASFAPENNPSGEPFRFPPIQLVDYDLLQRLSAILREVEESSRRRVEPHFYPRLGAFGPLQQVVLPHVIMPRRNYAPLPRFMGAEAVGYAVAPRNAIPQPVNRAGNERIEIPRDISGEAQIELQDEVPDPKYASKHVLKEYFQNKVPSMEVPPLPSGIDLQVLCAQLWSHVDSTWAQDRVVNDDNRWRSKNALLESINTNLALLAEENQLEGGAACPQTIQTIKNALGHVFKAFLERKAAIDAMVDCPQKEKALAQWFLEGRTFFMSLGSTFNHCLDRKLDDIYIYYVRYVERKPTSYNDIDTVKLEACLADLLKEYRQDLVRHVCTNVIETDMHHVDTERYVLANLSGELGLGLPRAFGASDALSNFAKRDKVAEVRQLFYRMYTPQSVTRHLIAEIKKAAATQDKKRNLYMKIVKWFEEQVPSRQPADIFDIEKNEFHEEAMITLLEKMHVIQ
jgi:hypothetical protein